ncbi:tRNA modification GTPase [Aquimarina sp. 2201CG1-2-11]|uniref:outer membrane beta-barrel protein n=1 Tax=Aquimarina discodermiae TaxID=3231043 RepID=UPI0034618C3F
MSKQLITILIAILSIQAYAQNTYKKGYVVNNQGEKIECLIKDLDWVNTPTKFEYKLNENDDVKTGILTSIKEFGVEKVAKYIRFKVDMDRPTNNINKMRYDKNPVFKEEQLFLKVLLEGKANLYGYKSGSLERFFYKTEDKEVEQLVYKKYKVREYKFTENTRYKEQLWSNLKCSDISIKDFNSVDYKKNDLINFFVTYNECNNSEFTKYQKKNAGGFFNINIRPGVTNSSLGISNNISFDTRDFDFGNKLGFRFGAELEYVFPFNNNKWSVLFEPTYRSYKEEREFNYLPNSIVPRFATAKVEYTSIEFPTGIRYYSYINNHSKLFFNVLLAFEYELSSSISSDSTDGGFNFDLNTDENWKLGMGYMYKNKFSVEFRYGTPRGGLSDNKFWSSDFKNVSLILGYTIFSNKKE